MEKGVTNVWATNPMKVNWAILALMAIGPRPLEGTRFQLPLSKLAPEPAASPREENVGLPTAVRLIHACAAAHASSSNPMCAGVIYVWSERMPLSSIGIPEIAAAASELELPLTLIEAGWLIDEPSTPQAQLRRPNSHLLTVSEDSLRRALVTVGASLHYPSVVVYRDGAVVGTALLGYKRAVAWSGLIRMRLASTLREGAHGGRTGGAISSEVPSQPPPDGALEKGRGHDVVMWRDLPVEGSPGPYFRSVPGRRSLAFEDERVIHLLNLESGKTMVGPGWIDFISSPDGKLFVMPDRQRAGLHFYEAQAVYREALAGRGSTLPPVFIDPLLRDQYPSVGVLDTVNSLDNKSWVRYRVITSWYSGVMFRDYEVSRRMEGLVVRPIDLPMAACPGIALSIPMISRDGREIAARDERTGTTKIFRLEDDGRCTETVDLGIATGKLAFDPTGRRVAFTIPSGLVRRAGAVIMGHRVRRELTGVFILDREDGAVRQVVGSKAVDRLTFPDFVGADSVIFLIRGDREDRFRLAPVPVGAEALPIWSDPPPDGGS